MEKNLETKITKYKVPEKVSNMTIHFGIKKENSVIKYLEKNHFGFVADLLVAGYDAKEIEEATTSENIKVTSWPAKQRITDFFWSTDKKSIQELEKLAKLATKYCYGKTANEAIGGNYISVGAEMESQQRAITGLIYARETEKVREIEELANKTIRTGPLYVAKGGFSDKMFGKLIPE